MNRQACTILLLAFATACSGGVTRPTNPPVPGNPNVAGAWSNLDGTRTWTLSQVGITAAGPSTLSEFNSVFGPLSATGMVVGTAATGTFIFEDTYEKLPKPDCVVAMRGHLTVNGDTMTGSYVERTSCLGGPVDEISGVITMKKK